VMRPGARLAEAHLRHRRSLRRSFASRQLRTAGVKREGRLNNFSDIEGIR